MKSNEYYLFIWRVFNCFFPENYKLECKLSKILIVERIFRVDLTEIVENSAENCVENEILGFPWLSERSKRTA